MESTYDIIAFFLELANNIKVYHWMTKSYARHVASDKLITELQNLSDKFIETYIGIYGRPSNKTIKVNKLTLSSFDDKSILSFLEKSRIFLQTTLQSHIKNNTDLQSIRDEILSAINQTLYLMTLQ